LAGHKVRVNRETYEQLKTYAEAEGLTVDDYVKKLVETNDLSGVC
jgi:hypothetical protein